MNTENSSRWIVDEVEALRDRVEDVRFYPFCLYCRQRHQGLGHQEALKAVDQHYYQLDYGAVNAIVDRVLIEMQTHHGRLWASLREMNYNLEPYLPDQIKQFWHAPSTNDQLGSQSNKDWWFCFLDFWLT